MMGNKARGTGFLISPNLVLTAAHNCFSTKIGIKNKNLKFYEASINESRSSSDGFIIGTKVKYP